MTHVLPAILATILISPFSATLAQVTVWHAYLPQIALSAPLHLFSFNPCAYNVPSTASLAKLHRYAIHAFLLILLFHQCVCLALLTATHAQRTCIAHSAVMGTMWTTMGAALNAHCPAWSVLQGETALSALMDME